MIDANYRRWTNSLDHYLNGVHVQLKPYHDDLLSDAWADLVRHEEKILIGKGGHAMTEKALGGLLYGFLRQFIMGRAVILYRNKVRRWAALEHSSEDEEDAERPRFFVPPEQEEVVFMKQLMEMCGRLPDEEAEVMRLVFDRATASEMAQEIGLSFGEMERRRAEAVSAAIRLAEGYGDTTLKPRSGGLHA